MPLYKLFRIGLGRYGFQEGVVCRAFGGGSFAPLPTTPPAYAARELGMGVYEISYDLSNVSATVSDYRTTVTGGGLSTVAPLVGVAGYAPGVREEHDHHPFGLAIPNRTRRTNQVEPVASGYWYCFKGKEDDEGMGGGKQVQDYGFRLCYKAAGRFLSVDPRAEKYAGWSPYNFVMRNPINNIDPEVILSELWLQTWRVRTSKR